MNAEISDRLARLMAGRDFGGLESNIDCRRALGVILLDKDRKNQPLGQFDAVAQYALFPVEHQKRVAPMIIKWSGADWGSPQLWSERFY